MGMNRSTTVPPRCSSPLRGLWLLSLALALCCCATAAQTRVAQDPPKAEGASRGRILLVLTNHGQLGDTGKRTGAFLVEAAEPWVVFTQAGFDVTIASPNGGEAPLDPKSLRKISADSQAFLDKFASDGVVKDTTSLSDIDPADYDAIFFTGGHGTMWDFPTSSAVRDAAQRIYDQGGVLAAICHGPAAFVQLKGDQGKPLVAGRKLTAFTDAEENAGRLAEVIPFMLETRLRELGAEFDAAPNFKENVVVDGRIITGQNPASARGAANEVVKALATNQRDNDN